MSKNKVKQVILSERVRNNNHMVSTEYRRHLRIQSMKVWVLLVAISAIFITTAAVIIR